jgi:hypothetical protein
MLGSVEEASFASADFKWLIYPLLNQWFSRSVPAPWPRQARVRLRNQMGRNSLCDSQIRTISKLEIGPVVVASPPALSHGYVYNLCIVRPRASGDDLGHNRGRPETARNRFENK